MPLVEGNMNLFVWRYLFFQWRHRKAPGASMIRVGWVGKRDKKCSRFHPTPRNYQHQSEWIGINWHQETSISINTNYSASISVNQHQWASIRINQYQHQSELISISINKNHSASIDINQHQYYCLKHQSASAFREELKMSTDIKCKIGHQYFLNKMFWKFPFIFWQQPKCKKEHSKFVECSPPRPSWCPKFYHLVPLHFGYSWEQDQ